MNEDPPQWTEGVRTPGNAEPQLGTAAGYSPPAVNAHAPQSGFRSPTEARASDLTWFSRGYLPHFDTPGTIQSLTFRLADSLPQTALHAMEAELQQMQAGKADVERRRKIENWLDSGAGCCALAHPRLAALMQETLLKWDGDRYRLLAWCVMPNHVHVLIETHVALARIVQSWKSFTGRWALRMNAELALGIPGSALWMREYWDRFIRDEQHFKNAFTYIEENPVKAKLCRRPQDWPWSSAAPWER